ncbi:MAG: tRNA (adenosine(37)-N6)-threonylcarbamoyltransferase complex dimerization subunit type 1 TsaB [Deinococcota bacterium]
MYLGIDTATPFLSLALWSPSTGTAASCQLELGRDHGARIISELNILFAQAQQETHSLQGIAVGLGPGSYTGLRVGIATARGLAKSLNCLLVGKSSLEAMAAQYLKNQPSDACSQPMHQVATALDARRGNIYVGRFRTQIRGKVNTLKLEGEIDKLNRAAFINTHSDWLLIENIAPSATYLARHAYEVSQDASNYAYAALEPYYL